MRSTLAISMSFSPPLLLFLFWPYGTVETTSALINNKAISFHSAISLIVGKIRITSNVSSSCMNSSIQEFVISKLLGILDHPRIADCISPVTWNPPLQGWVKCNSDGSAKGSPGLAGCGAIFRDHSANSLGCFSQNLGVNNSFFVEIMGVILAIEIAFNKGWLNLGWNVIQLW